MKTKLEKSLSTEEVKSTSKNILEQLFIHYDNERIKYEELITKYRNNNKCQQKIIKELKREKNGKNINKKLIKVAENIINKNKQKINNFIMNTDILWNNELKIGKELGYDLE